jgi:hypothetical protein
MEVGDRENRLQWKLKTTCPERDKAKNEKEIRDMSDMRFSQL